MNGTACTLLVSAVPALLGSSFLLRSGPRDVGLTGQKSGLIYELWVEFRAAASADLRFDGGVLAASSACAVCGGRSLLSGVFCSIERRPGRSVMWQSTSSYSSRLTGPE
ncbi:hypothetical protein B0J12DRAFT_665238 [Macrophomina phaseolina]|uniref:Secreted protein n=1 Tax=Macrophomina phaseolina TaxID=35725 RepID=A0ABQ8GA51_9PEZI|nr:hypothetical protein B0J12DRAFT_665238 [Macrophomina phaseolina]